MLGAPRNVVSLTCFINSLFIVIDILFIFFFLLDLNNINLVFLLFIDNTFSDSYGYKKMLVSSANSIIEINLLQFCISFMYSMNNNGPRIDP